MESCFLYNIKYKNYVLKNKNRCLYPNNYFDKYKKKYKIYFFLN